MEPGTTDRDARPAQTPGRSRWRCVQEGVRASASDLAVRPLGGESVWSSTGNGGPAGHLSDSLEDFSARLRSPSVVLGRRGRQPRLPGREPARLPGPRPRRRPVHRQPAGRGEASGPAPGGRPAAGAAGPQHRDGASSGLVAAVWALASLAHGLSAEPRTQTGPRSLEVRGPVGGWADLSATRGQSSQTRPPEKSSGPS